MRGLPTTNNVNNSTARQWYTASKRILHLRIKKGAPPSLELPYPHDVTIQSDVLDNVIPIFRELPAAQPGCGRADESSLVSLFTRHDTFFRAYSL